MDYATARPLICNGDLIAFRGTGLLSRLIRRVTMGSFSHVGVAWYWHEADRLFILENRELRGVTLRAMSNVGAFVWVSTGVDPLRWHPQGWRGAVASLGKPYSYLDAVRAGLNRPLRGDQTICSAYARAVLRDCGLDVPDRARHPQALVEWVQSNVPDSVTRVVG